MTEAKFYGKIKSRRVKGLPPGMVRYRLTTAAIDSDGKRHASGTEYVPLSGGYDNAHSQTYVKVVIVPKGM